jgi:hypothetical protein
MYNSISSIDLSTCTALTYIADAFRNNSLNSFVLPSPVVPGYIIDNWKDGAGTLYPVGSTVTNLVIEVQPVKFSEEILLS